MCIFYRGGYGLTDFEQLFEQGFNLLKEGNKEGSSENFKKVVEHCRTVHEGNAKACLYEALALEQLDKNSEAVIAYQSASRLYQETIGNDEKDANIWYYNGRALHGLSKYEEAIKSFDTALEIDPSHYKAWFEKGRIFHKLEKYNDSIRSFEEVIKIKPEFEQGWCDKGIVLYDIGKYEKALPFFIKATKINNKYSGAWYYKGLAYYFLKDYLNAEEAFNKVLEINSFKDAGSCYYKGLSLLKRREANNALKAFEEATSISPGYEDAWYYLGLLQHKFGKYHDAIRSFDKITPKGVGNNQLYINSLVQKGIVANKTLDQRNRAEDIFKNSLKTIEEEIRIVQNAELWYYKGLCLQNNEVDCLAAYEEALKMDPRYAYAWNSKGLALFKSEGNKESKESKKAFKTSIKILKKELKLNKNDGDLWYCKGIAHLYLEDYVNAIDAFNESLNVYPDDPDALNNIGLSYYFCKKFEESITYFDKALTINQNFTYALNNKGLALYALEKYEQAIETFKGVITIDKDNLFSLYNLGVAKYKIDELEEALKYFDAVVNYEQNWSDALYNRAFVQYKLEKYEESWESINRAIESHKTKSKNLKLLRCKALIGYQMGKYDEALSTLDKALEINPNDGSLWYNKGLLYSRTENYNKALEAYDKVLKINKNHVNALYNKGLAYYKLEEYSNAKQIFEKASIIAYDDENVWYNLGLVLYELEEYENSLNSFNNSIEINSKDSDTCNCLGIVYYTIGKYEKSKLWFHKALSIDQNNFLARVNLAQLLFKVGCVNGATKEVDRLQEKCSETDRAYSQSMSLMGEIELQKRKYKNAIFYFEKAISLDPFNPFFHLLKSHTRFLLSEFVSENEKNKYTEEMFSLICDLEKLNFHRDKKINAYILYFLGCCYYKINDLHTAVTKLNKCVQLKSGIPVEETAKTILNQIWAYQIKPPWWAWWWNSPTNSGYKKIAFFVISLSVFTLLLLHPILSKYYTLFLDMDKVGSSSVAYSYINWNLYTLSIILLVFILLFPSIQRIKGTDVEIELQAPPLPIEFYPLMPFSKLEHSPIIREKLIEATEIIQNIGCVLVPK